MLFFFEIALLAFLLFSISFPLLTRHARIARADELLESEFSDLLYKKEASYIALTDLEFDHNTEKISDADYRSMKAQFESEALAALESIDEYETGGRADLHDQPTAQQEPDDIRYCVSCGAKVKSEHKFCYKCGTAL